MKLANVVKRSLMLLAIAAITVTSALSAQTGTGTINSGNIYRTSAGGWYTSPYKATFTGITQVTSGYALPTPTTLYDIFCVDFYHHGQSYGANFSNLADANSINVYTRAKSVKTYTMAAWLASQLSIAPATSNGVINAAIWQVMGATTVTLGISQANINVWKTRADTGSVNAVDWVVITDRNLRTGYENDGQEFVTRVQVTPEPATMLLLGSGLLIMLMGAGVLRRPLV